jgi:hypothetical protein
MASLHPIPDFEPTESFPHAAQAIKLVRRRRSLTGRWHTATVYAITSRPAGRPTRAARGMDPLELAVDCQLHSSVTPPSTRTAPRSAPGPGGS